MKARIVLVVLVGFTMVAGVSLALSDAGQDKGAENIKLYGGKRGNVPFPHHQHQNKLGDCNICHSVFAQKTGIIEEMKSDGTLKKKYVMNKLCTKCHKEKKRAGDKSGPTTCSKCHLK